MKLPIAKNAAQAAANRESLRQQLSALLKRELTEAEAIDLATQGVRVLEQVERAKKRDQ